MLRGSRSTGRRTQGWGSKKTLNRIPPLLQPQPFTAHELAPQSFRAAPLNGKQDDIVTEVLDGRGCEAL